MIKLIDVESLGNSKFLVSVSNDGKLEKYIVTSKKVFIEEMNEEMSYFNSEDKKFNDIWGQSLAFRKKVSKAIHKLESLQPELQVA